MIVDKAVRDFTERYDEEMIESIDHMVNDPMVAYTYEKVKSFDIDDTFSLFNEYLDGYKEYVIKDKYDIGDIDKDQIIDSIHGLLKEKGFTEKTLFCKNADKFIKGYINGCKSLIEKVNNIQGELMMKDATNEEIGNINEYCDIFMEKMNEKFESTMTELLRHSGYIKQSFIFNDKLENRSTDKVINFI